MMKISGHFFLLVVFFINIHPGLSQNEYLKNDSTIYCTDIGKMTKVKSD